MSKILWFFGFSLILTASAQIRPLNGLRTDLSPQTAEYTSEVASSSLHRAGEEDSVIRERVKAIEWCESRGNESAVGDSGMARSVLQFWPGTFLSYAKKYDLFPSAEDAEIMNFYLDPDAQRELAYLMLKNEQGYTHWLRCSKMLGYIQ